MAAPRIRQVKILLVQTGFLGDIILSTPVIGAMHELHPNCELWILTTEQGKSLVSNDKRVSGVLTFAKRGAEAGLAGLFRKAKKLKEKQFDLVYSLHKSFRTSLLLWLAGIPKRVGFSAASGSFLYSEQKRLQGDHAVVRALSIIGDGSVLSEKHELSLHLSAERQETEELLAWQKAAQKKVVIAPGSVWETKRWAKEHYRQVAQKCLDNGWKVAVLGSNQEREVCNFVSKGLSIETFGNSTSIDQAMWVVKHADLVICNDSALLHVASAFKVPTVAIFCATSPKFGFGPWRNKSRVVELLDLECRPCRRHGSQSCPTGTRACMELLLPERVMASINELLV